MNTSTVKIRPRLVALIALLAALPVHGQDSSDVLSLQQAREAGRKDSRFLRPDGTAPADPKKIPKANLGDYKKSLYPILQKSCLGCHGPDRTEGRLRVDQLDPNLLTGQHVNQWKEIYNALGNSEMPPADETEYRLADQDRGLLVEWVGAELEKAYHVRKGGQDYSAFRRMTRYEYNYALQDLLGIPFDVVERLPPESMSDDGFLNRSELLQMSAMQFETSREIGLRTLQRVTVHGDPPKPVVYKFAFQGEMTRLTSAANAKVFNVRDDNYKQARNTPHFLNHTSGQAIHYSGGNFKPDPKAIVGEVHSDSPIAISLPPGRELKFNLDRFLPDEGVMRVRIRAARSNMNPQHFANLRLIFSAHTSNNANFSQVISQRDLPVTAPMEAPEYIDFLIPLGDIQRNPFRKLETTFPRRDEFLHIQNISNGNRGPEPLGVLIDHIEVSAPFYASWPPQSHREIFFDSANKGDEIGYAAEVLKVFMARAWRRTVTESEVAKFVELFKEFRSDFETFEETMQEVLATVIASPDFLYLTQTMNGGREGKERISDMEFATRLSFFLWASIPDVELLGAAYQGDLRKPEVLKSQIARMLNDPRANRFAEHFVGQWLGLDGLDSTTHVRDAVLLAAMQQEPVAFFKEVLVGNESVMDFIHSDYVVVNERLAGHYRVGEVYGPHFRRVSVAETVNRGGMLTQAGMLAMNSDGTDSHPLKRGIWMLERVLHDPPPPPPPNVPEVDLTDPRILQMTLKERIEDHRNKPACKSCHSKIDPWGIAFENYDALGAFRTQLKNGPVDANAELFNKQPLHGMTGLKRYLLLERQDQFARAIVEKMTTYAIGRSLSFSDNADINKIVVQFRRQEDRLGDLIQIIAQSEIFNSR
ncbi:MAG: hypothetical protein CMM02_09170 [Rhodopirellula sp.]|nr:hypothetical protein [Rhodopirellula sp.]